MTGARRPICSGVRLWRWPRSPRRNLPRPLPRMPASTSIAWSDLPVPSTTSRSQAPIGSAAASGCGAGRAPRAGTCRGRCPGCRPPPRSRGATCRCPRRRPGARPRSDLQRRQAVALAALPAQELAEAVAPDAGLHLDRVERLAGALDDVPEPGPELVGLRLPGRRLADRRPLVLAAQTDAARVLLALRHAATPLCVSVY